MTPKYVSVLAICAALTVAAVTRSAAEDKVIQTPMGDVPTKFGLPADDASIGKLYDELDYQRATQAYIWALPIVGFAQWQASTRKDLGAADTDLVVYESVKDKLGILTANATTPYIGGFPDLSATGPLVIDYPAGANGTYDIYFGPEAPEGKEKNWIPTLPGKAWFAYFRLYGPLEPYFDRSWKLPDIEELK